ncbi:MAG: helix-turn-helix domain-containing protein [Methylomonas sp.]
MRLDEIGRVIRKARKAHQLTQAQLSASLGMSRATLSAIENGTVPEIGIRKILSLCDALSLELISQPKSKRPTLQQLIRENDNA